MTKRLRPDFHERSFGISVGTVLLAIAAYAWWREQWTVVQWTGGIGAALLLLGLTRPRLLKWPSAAWWKMAAVLGFVNARVLLTLAFALMLTPMGLLWRAIGHDPLARRRKNWPGWTTVPERFRDPNHFTRMY